MGTGRPNYWFDRWAEYLTVSLAENIARCTLTSSPIQKIRIQLEKDTTRPVGFKVFMENGLMANSSAHRLANEENDKSLLAVEYYYHSPCQVPLSSHESDTVAEQFIPKAVKWDEAFYPDAWSVTMDDCIPSLLRQLAYRSVVKMLPVQLHEQGIDLAEDFEVQFHDGENFCSFPYDSISAEIKRQIGFYLGDAKVLDLATEICLKHRENRAWFKALKP